MEDRQCRLCLLHSAIWARLFRSPLAGEGGSEWKYKVKMMNLSQHKCFCGYESITSYLVSLHLNRKRGCLEKTMKHHLESSILV